MTEVADNVVDDPVLTEGTVTTVVAYNKDAPHKETRDVPKCNCSTPLGILAIAIIVGGVVELDDGVQTAEPHGVVERHVEQGP